MRLSDFFTLSNKTSGTGTEKKASASDPSRTALINRQIKALTPGQTISGEIVARSGNEVQIRLSEDMVLNARLEQNINLELGRGMTFEVKNNGASLTLCPLFANTATDANVLKALDMAALPVNSTTVEMTQSLMESGLSVDKGSLQQVYREISSHPQAQIADVVDLHRLGLPVTEENLSQLASYKNLSYQLTEGINSILGEIPDIIGGLAQNGRLGQAAGLTEALLALTEGLTGRNAAALQNAVADAALAEAGAEQGDGVLKENGIGEASPENSGGTDTAADAALHGTTDDANDAALGNITGRLAFPDSILGESAGLDGHAAAQLTQKLQALLDGLELPPETYAQLSGQLESLADGAAGAEGYLQLAGSLLRHALEAGHSSRLQEQLTALLTDQGLNEMLAGAVKENWTIRPQELRDPHQTNELYNRLNRQLHSLADALESAGASGSSAARSTGSMLQNLDFMQQLNQMYTYVQLPLKMGRDTAHGDLYVYTNKKHLASGDGSVSALLHLDMAHLGPLDVYVALQGARVSTRFYVSDDSMLDFLAEHMDLLNKRLQERGYDMKCEMQVREKNSPGNPALAAMLQENAASAPLVQYAFDVRA